MATVNATMAAPPTVNATMTRPTAPPTVMPSSSQQTPPASPARSRYSYGCPSVSGSLVTVLRRCSQKESNSPNSQRVKGVFDEAFRYAARFFKSKKTDLKHNKESFIKLVIHFVKISLFDKKAENLNLDVLDNVISEVVDQEFHRLRNKDDRSELSEEMQFLILMDSLISVGFQKVFDNMSQLHMITISESKGIPIPKFFEEISNDEKTYGDVARKIGANFKGHWPIKDVKLPEGWLNDNNKKMQVSIMLALSLVSNVRSPLDKHLYPDSSPNTKLSEYLQTDDNLSNLVELVLKIIEQKPDKEILLPEFKRASYWERFNPGVGFIALGGAAALGYTVCLISNQSRPFPQDIEVWKKYTDCIARPFSRITRKCGDRPVTSLTVTNDFMSQINGVMSQITGIMSQINISQITWNSLFVGGMMFCTAVIVYNRFCVSKQANKQAKETQ